MKICSKCNIEKDLSEFNVRKRNKDGLKNICKTCANEEHKKWCENNKLHIKIYNKKQYNNNKEYHKEKNKKFRKKNVEYGKNWREENSEKCKEYGKQWIKNNPDKCKEKCRKYRAKKFNVDGNFTEKEFQEKLQLYNYKCCACGVNLRKTNYHRDHIQPISKNGNNHIDNIQPLCEHCNLSKNIHWIDYRDNWLQNYGI